MRQLKLLSLLLVLSSTLSVLTAQTLPPMMRFSADGRRIITGDRPPQGLYDSATIRSVYLDFSQPNYWSLLTQNYATKTDLPATLTIDGVIYDSVGVRFKGQTSYMGTQNSQKKSFNISVNYAFPQQRVMGYRTLNLNNSFQDPSFLREVFYLHQIRRHIPAASANFVNLYINGQNWGLYPNVQQLNKDFLEEWFFSNDGANWRADRPDSVSAPGPGPGGGWGDGTAALNYLGPDPSAYYRYYDLKSSDVDNPWHYLVTTCQMLNTTPLNELPNVLPRYLDVDRTLWFLASEIAWADDDSYVYKGKMDYYVYYEPETGRMTPIEYDGNSVLLSQNASWGPFYNASKVNYPLLNRLLSVPMWRQRYLAHLRTIIEEEMNPEVCNAMLDNYKAMIAPYVQADPKKLYSYAQFESEVNVLKNRIATRRSTLLSNPEVSQIAPSIQEVFWQNTDGEPWGQIRPDQPVYVTARVSSNTGIFEVNLFYSNQLTGNFTPIPMYDDGQHRDGAAGDGIFGATLPAQSAGSWVRFYLEAVANNSARSVSYEPAGAEHDVFVYFVQPNANPNATVVINEIMASNATTAQDPQGHYDDWIELFNLTSQPVDLSGYYLTDKANNPTKFRIPDGVSIPANGYLIFWADEDTNDGPTHCNFKLSAEGELVYLFDPSVNLVDSVTFGPQQTDMGYARVPNGTGAFRIQAPTFAVSNDIVGAKEPQYTPAGLRIGPNPANRVLTIAIENATPDAPLTVIDSYGRIIWQHLPYATTFALSVADWPSGVYWIQYAGEVVRFVVQH